MATTFSSIQTYNSEKITDLGVVPIYEDLMKASVNKDSVYIRAKDTMQAFFDESTLTDSEKAAVLSQMLTGMTTSITSQAMSNAVAIAKENRDGVYELTKLREDTLLVAEQRDKVAAENIKIQSDIDKADADAALTIIQGWKIQTDMVRDNGAVLSSLPAITNPLLSDSSVTDKGIKWEQEQQTKMSVYATLAKSYRESGVVSWTVDAGTNKINSITDLAPYTPGLTKAQEKVAIRQEIGFDDNKRQHAANSSANMIGLLLSAEESGNITAADVTKWRTAVDYLNTPTT